MKILVTSPSRNKDPENNNEYDLIIQQDDWNDFSFVTKYHLYLTKKITGANEIEYAGSFKLIKKGQSESDFYMLARGEHEFIEEDFCSVGQTLDYYERLSKLNKEVTKSILFTLRDINSFDYVSEGFKEERAWQRSIMRDLKEDDDIFVLPNFIINHQFSSMPSIDVKFTFSHPGMLKSLCFDFDSNHYGFFDSYKLPGRMAVIVGRNGSGKSTTLARLSRVAYSSSQDRKDNILKDIGEIYPEGLGFPKLINLSYSAFDSFQIPGISLREKKQLRQDISDGKGRYIYCGIRDVCAELDIIMSAFDDNRVRDLLVNDRLDRTILKPLEVLSDEFCKALEGVLKDNERSKLFKQAMSKLKEEASISSIVDTILMQESHSFHKEFFHGLSTGHKFVLHSMIHILLHIEKRCLVLFDEPETHLHPPLLAVLMSALRGVLESKDAFAIIATHSPVVVQETLSKNVNIISRSGELTQFYTPEIETFGENIGLITSSVFSLTSQITDYHSELDNLIREYKNKTDALQLIEKCFDDGMSMQARAYVISKLAIKE